MGSFLYFQNIYKFMVYKIFVSLGNMCRSIFIKKREKHCFQKVYRKRVYFSHFCELISRGVFHINIYINNYLLSLSEKELIILIVLIFL